MCRGRSFGEFRTLAELLDDSLTRLLMQADNVDPEQVKMLFGSALLRVSMDQASPQGHLVMFSERLIEPRSGVCIMLLNDRNEVLVGHRIGISDRP